MSISTIGVALSDVELGKVSASRSNVFDGLSSRTKEWAQMTEARHICIMRRH